jgi:rhodanese-related sulfurtransferase
MQAFGPTFLLTSGKLSAMTLTLAELLAEARAGLSRLTPLELSEKLEHDSETVRSGSRTVVVLDTRTPSDRALYGCIPGSIHTPRTVLEWRVAPDAPLRLPEIHGADQLLVVVCNEGFSSSIAAATLQRFGFINATDLIGGFMAWRDAGLSTIVAAADEVGLRHDT